MRPAHVYEVRPRSDKRGVDLIGDAVPLVACDMPSQTQSAMQLGTESSTAVHTTRWFAFAMKRATWLRRTRTRAISKNR